MDDNITNNEEMNLEEEKKPSIDELQKLILQKMEEDKEESIDDEESTEEFVEEESQEFGSSLENEYYDISPIEKKYVISVSSDVVPYFEKMDPEDRADLVNSLVLEHIEKQQKIPEEEKIKKLITHSFVVIATIAIGVPLFFTLTNASIEATVNSYREVQTNFEKLYSQKGGVKRKDLTKMQNLQY